MLRILESINKYSLFSIVILIFVAAMLIWIAFSRIHDFKTYHTAIATESTHSAAQDIASFIDEKKRLVTIFGNEHRELIHQLAKDPENSVLNTKLNERIKLFFPQFFTFTISNAQGTPYLEDFDGLVGDVCLNDLQQYASEDTQLIRIHPNPEAYHFDISAKIPGDLILFISFHADILGNILNIAQAPGHNLMLIYKEASYLIEANDKGARNNTPREDYRLKPEEKERIILSQNIPETHWMVSDFHNPKLFVNYNRGIITNNLFIFVMFSFVVSIMVFITRKEERLRQEAEQHKDDFLSIINHELRTPITSIKGSLGLLASGVTGEMTEQSKKLVHIALNNSERLHLLINDILDIKKYESGNMELHRQATSMDSFIKESLELHQGYAESFNVTFQLSELQPNIIANIDRDRINQVMSNLLSNAAKYGAERDTIEVSVTKHNEHARISVTDHGPGIPEMFHKRLFKKFTQSSIKHHKGGTGLGLNIAKMIIEAHHGKISFITGTNIGTTFHVDLPLNK